MTIRLQQRAYIADVQASLITEGVYDSVTLLTNSPTSYTLDRAALRLVNRLEEYGNIQPAHFDVTAFDRLYDYIDEVKKAALKHFLTPSRSACKRDGCVRD